MSENLKSLLSFWENLATHQRYDRFVEDRDIETVRTRVDNEGLCFLTTTLPNVGKALDKFHSLGSWTPPSGFALDSDGIPFFLNGAIRLALDSNSSAVDCVRQLSLAFYKLEVDYDDHLVARFLDDFVKVDEGLASDVDFADDFVTKIIEDMRRTIGRILCNEDPTDIRPCHGGGATACRTKNRDKWASLRYYGKLDQVFPYGDYFFYSFSHLSDEMEKLIESKESDPQARVCLVPKDSRGPRIISCEPAELLFIQQGLMRKLYSVLETHCLTAGQLNFTDQKINRDLARKASIDGSLATLDLSEASDRVSLEVVRRVFPPAWLSCLEACRSETTLLPDGRTVKLNKFAPMGSSVCFPVEALVFWTCARASIRLLLGVENPEVFVYGDDIIVPSAFADVVIRGLTSVGLVVNGDKSYKDGPFRESCGGDFHNGVDVTPVRVRKFLVSTGTGLATSADLANEIIAKFGEAESASLISVIEEAVGYAFPRSQLSLPVTIKCNPRASNDVFFRRRFNKHLQRLEHRVLTISTHITCARPADWSEILRKELTRELRANVTGSSQYVNLLQQVNARLDPGQYADSHSVRTKWSWVWLGEPTGDGSSHLAAKR